MKEELIEIRIPELPGTEDAFRALMLEQIATPAGSAAMFIVALNLYVQNPELGRICLNMIRADEPIADAEIRANFAVMAEKHPTVPRSYLKGASPQNGYTVPEGPLVMLFKLTNERTLKRKAKTVYVGCSGTGAYRPITLCSKPPRYVHKRFGVRREYESDPWFVTDYPSLLLPVR